MPISYTEGLNKYYLHYDQVGSLRAISDNNHNIKKEIVYDSFGNIVSDSNPNIKVPFAFAGGLYDEDTKLLRFGYRDYDSFTGKWTAKDPIDFDGDGYNLYGYVLNDPVNFVDILGLCGNKTLTIGESFQKLWDSKNRIGNDIKRAFDNSHPAIKTVVVVNASIIAIPSISIASEATATYVITHPEIVVDIINGAHKKTPNLNRPVEAGTAFIKQLLE